MKICKKLNHSYSEEYKKCPECHKAYMKARYEANPEQHKVNVKAWQEANKDQVKANMKAYKQANPAKCKALNKAWQLANPEQFKAKCNATRAKRRAKKLNATPKWLTPEQLHSIELFYQAAKWVESILEQPIHVDHIIPLQGATVSGLHVPWNLQLLTATENQIKGNKQCQKQLQLILINSRRPTNNWYSFTKF